MESKMLFLEIEFTWYFQIWLLFSNKLQQEYEIWKPNIILFDLWRYNKDRLLLTVKVLADQISNRNLL